MDDYLPPPHVNIDSGLYPAIEQYELGESITYYHLECPNYVRDNMWCGHMQINNWLCKFMNGIPVKGILMDAIYERGIGLLKFYI